MKTIGQKVHPPINYGELLTSKETGVRGPHLVIELPFSENRCIWAGQPLVDPFTWVPMQNPSLLWFQDLPLLVYKEGTLQCLRLVCGCWQVRDQFIKKLPSETPRRGLTTIS